MASFLASCGGNVVNDNNANAGAAAGSTSSVGGGGAGVNDVGGTSTVAGNNGLTPITSAQWDEIGAEACAGGDFPGGLLSLDLVVDVSAKMGEVVADGSGRTKWELTRGALQRFIDGLPDTSQVGLFLFPNQPPRDPSQVPMDLEYCVNAGATMPRQPLGSIGSTQRTRLADALAAAIPQGARPIADAFGLATGSELIRSDVSSVANFALIADGPPTLANNCIGAGQETSPVDYQPILTEISDVYWTYGSRTYVIGLPGSEEATADGADGRAWLSQVARLGGASAAQYCSDSYSPYCHYDLSQSNDLASSLSDAFQSIVSSYLDCTSILSGPPLGQTIDMKKVNVAYFTDGSTNNPILIGNVDADCTEGNGWYATIAGEVKLCAQTCATLQQNAASRIEIRAGCLPIVWL